MHSILSLARNQQGEKRSESDGNRVEEWQEPCQVLHRGISTTTPGTTDFVHEHPEKSEAWDMPEITELMAHAEVGSVVLHMCFRDDIGRREGRGASEERHKVDELFC